MAAQWDVYYDLDDLIVTGPGGLEIVIRDFRHQRPVHDAPLSEEILGDLIQRSWSVEISEGVVLQLVTTRRPEGGELHLLHVGSMVSWELPGEFAERLHLLAIGLD